MILTLNLTSNKRQSVLFIIVVELLLGTIAHFQRNAESCGKLTSKSLTPKRLEPGHPKFQTWANLLHTHILLPGRRLPMEDDPDDPHELILGIHIGTIGEAVHL
jgi:hypothetical protein